MKTIPFHSRIQVSASLAGLLLLASATVHAGPRQLQLEAALAQPYVKADQTQVTYLKVGLTGFNLDEPPDRSPVNVAIVLDKSGSMSGEKIRRAREAAKLAIGRLRADDIVSVVTYDTQINVLVPATKVSDRQTIYQAIDKLEAGGSTALFAGVSKGAEEVRKFLDRNRVNRVVLLSDGKANCGPSSPGELGSLGASLAREGITVSTIGLGLDYNEDLMVSLAGRSDGNHYFVRDPEQLTKIFDAEFGDVLSVVAQEVVVNIHCKSGVRPVRVLGRDAEIRGQDVVVSLNQIYSKQEKYVLLEVEVPAAGSGKYMEVATVHSSYANLSTDKTDELDDSVGVHFTDSDRLIADKVNRDVMVSCVAQIAVENNKRATWLRDQGRVEEARKALTSNAEYLQKNSDQYQSEMLRRYGASNFSDAGKLDDDAWKSQRKKMRYEQNALNQQQAAPLLEPEKHR